MANILFLLKCIAIAISLPNCVSQDVFCERKNETRPRRTLKSKARNVHALVCKAGEDKICLFYDPITNRLKQNPKLKAVKTVITSPYISHHIKEFHRKDHHHLCPLPSLFYFAPILERVSF